MAVVRASRIRARPGSSSRRSIAGQLAPEVEALVWSGLTHDVLRTGIDVVFRLVGELRTHWRGITGGDGPAQLAKVLASIVEAV